MNVIANPVDFKGYGISFHNHPANIAVQLLAMLFINCGLSLNGGKHNVIDHLAVAAHRIGFLMWLATELRNDVLQLKKPKRMTDKNYKEIFKMAISMNARHR